MAAAESGEHINLPDIVTADLSILAALLEGT
jgi:hypothetical protein